MKNTEKKIDNKEREVLNLIRDSLFSYKSKFLHAQDGCVYFILDEVLYGFSQIKADTGSNVFFVWFEDCSHSVEWNEEYQENILVKSYPEDYMLLEYEDLLELYTLLNMEIKLQSERENKS